MTIMKLCKKCNEQIPNRVWIEGKLRTITKRSFCLKCSPFGTHNTKQLHIELGISGDRTCHCSVCDRDYIYSKRKANSTVRCNSCYVRERRKILKDEAINLKGGKCIICGYNKCPMSMDFHHLNPAEKEFSISGNNISRVRLFRELQKCVLVCRNCHGEIESGITTINGVVA